MTYKTILVHVDDAKNVDTRIELAAQLALAHDAHLIGSAMTGVSRFLYESVASGAGDPGITPYLDILQQQATLRLQHFDALARHSGVASFERRLSDDEPEGSLVLQARYADLVILGQYDRDGTIPSVYADLPEYVTLNSVSPVLIVPYTASMPITFDRIMIAWNGGMEAARAIRNALPLLCAAKVVEIVVFNGDRQPEVYGQEPGADIALFLARHQITATVLQEYTDTDPGNALLSLAADRNTDLLVMGCYGHSRFREILLGGVTRTLLESMTVPVLMSH